MGARIPSTILGTLETFNGKVAYSYGPNQTGTPMSSGTYFSGNWGAVFRDGMVYIKKLESEQEYLIPTSTGTPLSFLSPGQLNSADTTRFTNLAFAFNNSGNPFIAVQDNGEKGGFPTPPKTINFFWLSGNTYQQSVWEGNSPSIYNDIQINFPPEKPPRLYPRWQTGSISIFYQKNSDLYQRVLSENFTGEYLVLTGSTGDYIERTSVYLFENSFKSPYHPYRFSLFNPSSDKTRLRALVSISTANAMFDDIKRYETGKINTLFTLTGYTMTGGWGNWAAPILLDSSKGVALSLDIWFADNYVQYATGSISGSLDIQTGRFYLQPTGTMFQTASLFYDTFDNYQTGELGFFDTSNMTGVQVQNVGATAFRIIQY
jgi:hypothetical protein